MPALTLDTLRELSDPDLRLAVLGDPIDHSLSPPMHNAGLTFRHLPFRYGRVRVSPEELRTAFEILRNKNFIGWNLTLPHKLAALDLLDELDPLAERLKAVNTVVNRSNRLLGFNTDGEGLVAAISEEFRCNISGVRIALLGAGGGAGQAAARYLAELKVPDLILLNRTAAKAEALAGELERGSNSNVRAELWERLPQICNEADLIINASTTGPAVELLNGIEPRHMVFDMVYGPQETPLVTFSRAKGARSADGLLMLLFQGIFAFEIWFGKPAPAAEMRDALFKAAGRVSLHRPKGENSPDPKAFGPAEDVPEENRPES